MAERNNFDWIQLHSEIQGNNITDSLIKIAAKNNQSTRHHLITHINNNTNDTI